VARMEQPRATSESRLQPVRRSATDGRWRLAVAGVPLTVERMAKGGGWSVLLGGFSRASGERLVEAIAIATGAQSHDPWIVELAARIEAGVSLR
jgi:uncharacterized circularly permuted ATP-grasp superfamily protein